jgi:hypothetical protein
MPVPAFKVIPEAGGVDYAFNTALTGPSWRTTLLSDFDRSLEKRDLFAARRYGHERNRFRQWIEQSRGEPTRPVARSAITGQHRVEYFNVMLT